MAITLRKHRKNWPNATVPISVDSSITDPNLLANINESMRRIMDATNNAWQFV